MPCIQDWSDHRETVTFLYRTQGRELKDVQKIMKDEHGFHASENMYKKKLRQWRLRRSISAAEKNFILGEIKRRERSGKRLHQATLRGQPVDMSALFRHRKGLSTSNGEVDHVGPKHFSRIDTAIRVYTPRLEHSMSLRANGPNVARENNHPNFHNTAVFAQPAIERPLEMPPDMRHSSIVLHACAVIYKPGSAPQATLALEQTAPNFFSLVSLLDYCSIANKLVALGQFAAARILINRASNILFDLSSSSTSRQPSCALAFLPITLGSLVLFHGPTNPDFDAINLFYRHALALLMQRLGPGNPIVDILSSFHHLNDKLSAYIHIFQSVSRSLNSLPVSSLAAESSTADPTVKAFECSTRYIISYTYETSLKALSHDSLYKRIATTVEANEQTLGPLHRQTLSLSSNLAWTSLTHAFSPPHGTVHALELFEQLISRLRMQASIARSTPELAISLDITFMAEAYRGAAIAAAADKHWGKAKIFLEKAIEILDAGPSVDQEHRQNMLAFYHSKFEQFLSGKARSQ